MQSRLMRYPVNDWLKNETNMSGQLLFNLAHGLLNRSPCLALQANNLNLFCSALKNLTEFSKQQYCQVEFYHSNSLIKMINKRNFQKLINL